MKKGDMVCEVKALGSDEFDVMTKIVGYPKTQKYHNFFCSDDLESFLHSSGYGEYRKNVTELS